MSDQEADGPLTSAAVRERFEQSVRQWEWQALAAVLTRYVAQPLSDSEAAWAYKMLANAFAVGEQALEAVATHESFERWLPGKSPCLSAKFPYYPAPEASPGATMGPDEIRVEFLSQSVEFATSYGAVGRYDEYVSKFDAALARLSPTKDNAELRFYSVRIYAVAAQIAGDFARAERIVRAMHAIADEAQDTAKVAELHATALMAEVQLARAQNDNARRAETLQRGVSLLEELEKEGSSGSDWVRGYRHELAHHLIPAGRHDVALPLLDAILATGDHFGGGYGWLMHAAAVWQVSRDRPRTLGLLRDARDHDGRDLVGEFRGIAGFGGVRDDPEFLEAISRSLG